MVLRVVFQCGLGIIVVMGINCATSTGIERLSNVKNEGWCLSHRLQIRLTDLCPVTRLVILHGNIITERPIPCYWCV